MCLTFRFIFKIKIFLQRDEFFVCTHAKQIIVGIVSYILMCLRQFCANQWWHATTRNCSNSFFLESFQLSYQFNSIYICQHFMSFHSHKYTHCLALSVVHTEFGRVQKPQQQQQNNNNELKRNSTRTIISCWYCAVCLWLKFCILYFVCAVWPV